MMDGLAGRWPRIWHLLRSSNSTRLGGLSRQSSTPRLGQRGSPAPANLGRMSSPPGCAPALMASRWRAASPATPVSSVAAPAFWQPEAAACHLGQVAVRSLVRRFLSLQLPRQRRHCGEPWPCGEQRRQPVGGTCGAAVAGRQHPPQPWRPVQLSSARPLLPSVRPGGAALALLPPGLAQQGTQLASGGPALRGGSGGAALPLLCGGAASTGGPAHPHRDHTLPPAPEPRASGMVVQQTARLPRSGQQ